MVSMKNLFLFAAICAFLFTGCSNDDDQSGPGNESAKIVFDLGVTNRLSEGFERSIVSSTPVNNVSIVNIYVFKEQADNSYKWIETLPVTQWSQGMTSYSYSVTDNTPFVGGGNFKFIAVGRNSANDDYTIPNPTTTTDFNSFLATSVDPTFNNDIFAGNTNIVPIASGGTARVSLTMTRKVAGVMGYFSNVPISVTNAQGVATPVGALIVTVQETGNTAVNLVTGVGSNPGVLSDFNVVGRIDLTTQQNDGNFFTGNNPAGVAVLPNTQLDGRFVIPLTAATMKVQLLGTDNVTILKEWSVLDQNGNTTFPLVANNLYTIGKKANTTDTNGDTPINLSQNEIITITVNPNWEVINELGVQQ